MADILIRNVSASVKQRLQTLATRRGKSLEADLREALERLSRDAALSPDEAAPFGDWLVAVSRPGTELDDTLKALRKAPSRPLPKIS